jgi:hypothetical protein
MGIKIKIQLPHDPSGREGVAIALSDVVTIAEPKEDPFAKATAPYAQNIGQPQQPVVQQQQVAPQQQMAPQDQMQQQIPQQQVEMQHQPSIQ